MRILHVDSGREMRGGQWQVFYLMRGVREQGHEQKLLARGPLVERARAEGFDAEPLSLRALGADVDMIHCHDAKSHTLAAFARRPLVVSRRVAFPVRPGVLSRWKYGRARHYIAISRSVAGELERAGVKSGAISVVYDGVPLPPEVGRADGPVVAPATADPMKGSDLVRQAARLAGVEVVFSEDLPRDLAGASAFVYITRSEGLGSAALLAMAHGVPVIASRVGGLPEAIVEGETGLLVENDPANIASALRAVAEDVSLRRRLGGAGRERVERYFSLASMVEGTVRVYEKVRG
jgi:hypothetical protein